MKRKIVSTIIFLLFSAVLGGCAGKKDNVVPSTPAILTGKPVITILPTATSKPTAVPEATVTPEPVATQVPTATQAPATPKPTATQAPATSKPTATQAPATPKPTATFPCTGTVISDGLNVRKGAGTSYEVITAVGKGTKVSILSAKKAANGAYWYQIAFTSAGEEQTGYVNSTYVGVDYPELTETPPPVTATPKPTVTATPKPTATPTATPTTPANPLESISGDEVVDDLAFYLYAAEIQKNGAKLKDDFVSDAIVITELPVKTPAIVLNQSRTENGIWYRIAIKQNDVVVCGYVTSDTVKLLASAETPVAAQIVEENVRLRNEATVNGTYIRNKEDDIVTLSIGDPVWIIREVFDLTVQEKWFEIAVEANGEVYRGYVQETPVYLMETVTEAPTIPTR